MLSYTDANQLLSNIIDKLQVELKAYAARPDSKPGFIEKQNNLIANLILAYNGLQIQNAEALQVLGKKMEEMRKLDPYMKGFTIFLTENPTGYMGRIDLNLCTP